MNKYKMRRNVRKVMKCISLEKEKEWEKSLKKV